MNSSSSLINELENYSFELDEGCKNYWKYHKARYNWFLKKLKSLIESESLKKDCRILDIAPLYQTLLMSKMLPDVVGN